MLSSQHNKKAFTLIEVLLVITVMALLATVTVTTMARTLERMRFQTVFEKVEQMIFDARSMALSGKMVTDCSDVDHDDDKNDEVVAAGYGINIKSQTEIILFSDAHNYEKGSYKTDGNCSDTLEREYILPDGYTVSVNPEAKNFVYVPPDAVFTSDSVVAGPYTITILQEGAFTQTITIGQAGIPEKGPLTELE